MPGEGGIPATDLDLDHVLGIPAAYLKGTLGGDWRVLAACLESTRGVPESYSQRILADSQGDSEEGRSLQQVSRIFWVLPGVPGA